MYTPLTTISVWVPCWYISIFSSKTKFTIESRQNGKSRLSYTKMSQYCGTYSACATYIYLPIPIHIYIWYCYRRIKLQQKRISIHQHVSIVEQPSLFYARSRTSYTNRVVFVHVIYIYVTYFDTHTAARILCTRQSSGMCV